MWAHLGDLLLGRACPGPCWGQSPSASVVPRVGAELSRACPTEHLGPGETGQLLQSVCLLLGSRTRDVVKAALGFLKAALLLVDVKLLTTHVPTIVSSPGGVHVLPATPALAKGAPTVGDRAPFPAQQLSCPRLCTELSGGQQWGRVSGKSPGWGCWGSALSGEGGGLWSGWWQG